ncbi:aurora kinase A- and ninein-interacting protein [Mixophyes fleayi]|uniref:aurora kinase A- and ninein-interacting protein n=1 Tax=Mixophyes fleayi TaxID=3061075 RepID=UPI003F4DF7DD
MKGRSKRARSPQHPEECGVWLDTAQLKRRSQQAVIPCTSSVRLNPLSRRCPIDSAVFEFTQTKTTQLCTKQTSMYSFFTPAAKRNKLTSSIHDSIQRHSFKNSCNKRRKTENMTMNSSPLGTSACLKQEYSVDEPAVYPEDVNSFKTYKDIEQPAHLEQSEKEEISCVLVKPGYQMSCFSHHALFKTKENSVKSNNCWVSGNCNKNPVCLPDSTCPKEKYDTVDNRPSLCLLDSQLFTQDTQGNRVICHKFANSQQRNFYPALPLLDRTNVTLDVASPLKGSDQFFCDEVSLRKMFTQDSEGNMVLKH